MSSIFFSDKPLDVPFHCASNASTHRFRNLRIGFSENYLIFLNIPAKLSRIVKQHPSNWDYLPRRFVRGLVIHIYAFSSSEKSPHSRNLPEGPFYHDKDLKDEASSIDDKKLP
jgi:hypothetical protein